MKYKETTFQAETKVKYPTVLLSLTLIGCAGGPRISDSKCEESLKKQQEFALSSKDSTEYAKAMLAVRATLVSGDMRANLANAFSGILGTSDKTSVDLPSSTATDYAGAICSVADGFTATKVIQESESLTVKVQRVFEKQKAERNIVVLETAQKDAATIADSLKSFEVVDAKLLQSTDILGMLETTIVLTVLNNTNHSISRAYFSGIAKTDGREVPWLQETFNYSIPGGIAPKEKQTWRLQPNMFSGEWSSVRVPSSARFEVSVEKLDDPSGNALWGGARFSKADAELLDSLKRLVSEKN